MKRSIQSILSLFLAAIMLLGILASCTGNAETTEGSSETTAEINSTENTETSGKENSESSDENVTDGSLPETTSGDSEQTDSSDTDSDTSSETESETDSEVLLPPPPDYTLSNGDIIENANALKNGVNAYFTDGKRTDFALVNQNMTLEYALAAGKAQQVTSIVNSEGKSYIKNTADVFVKFTNNQVFYASRSTKPATANLYRLGYYMYEARFEEQNFMAVI